MLPGILQQLGPDGLLQLKKIASDIVSNKKLAEDEDDVPELVVNFDEVATNDKKPVEEAPAASSTAAPTATVINC